MLSNTATPKYYGQFRNDVLSGRTLVCNEIALQMKRIDRRIANPKYYYDGDAVEAYINFCNGEMTLTDGSPMHLLPSFKLWAEDVYGWYYFNKRDVYVPDPFNPDEGQYISKTVKLRLTQKQYLIVARGAAKTVYASTHHAYWLTTNSAAIKQIATAPTVRQADETLSLIRTSISVARGPYFKMLTYGSISSTNGSKLLRPKLFSSKKGIQCTVPKESLLEVIPMDVDKLQGSRAKIASIDEWLSGDTREDPTSAIEQGASKNNIEDYLIIATSSEGTTRNGIGDEMKLELERILRGEYEAEHVSIWYYKLDDITEVNNKRAWIKAQPNLGYTVTYEAYQKDVRRAEVSPAARNDILAKRFGLPMEGDSYFFTTQEIQPHPHQDFRGLSCAMGADMSQGDDFCSFAFLFPFSNGMFGVKTINFISQKRYDRLLETMRNKYDTFIKEGSLVIMPGTILDMDLVYEEVDRFINANNYDVECVGYDPYNAAYFMNRWSTENGPYGLQKVIQGSRTETVPLGELKALAQDRLLLFDEKIMNFAMGNAIVREDTNGNRKLLKKRHEAKIDPVAATMDALVAFKLYKELFA